MSDYYHLKPQVFTGVTPFSQSQPAAVISAILAGKRPSQPTHPAFTSELWMLTQRCWTQDPQLRPEVSKVLKVLRDSWALPF